MIENTSRQPLGESCSRPLQRLRRGNDGRAARPLGRALILWASALSLVGTGAVGGYLLGVGGAPEHLNTPKASATAVVRASEAMQPRLRAKARVPDERSRTPEERTRAGEPEDPATSIGSVEPSAPPPITAEEERDRSVERVRSSGPDLKNLMERARAVGESLATVAERLTVQARVGPWECYSGGCFTTIIHNSEAGLEDLTTELSHTEEFRGWEGPKMRSGPISRPDGAVEITWILFSDDATAARATSSD
jgi:hypothetical protein